MHAAKQMRLRRNCRRCSRVSSWSSCWMESIHFMQKSAFFADRRNVFDGGKGRGAVVGIGHVVVEQGEIELDVNGLFIELPGEIEPRLGRVDVLVEVQHQVVGDDRVAGGEEGDESLDQMDLGRT